MRRTGDWPDDELRAALHRAADLAADYLTGMERFPVLPRVEPGAVRAALPASPPEAAEPLATILADYQGLIEPNLTHWNHPGFLAYIAISGSAAGVVGETLAAALNVNAMLWRTAPAATELEEVSCDWVRQMVGLHPSFRGHINDTASISVFLSLAAARERAYPEVRRHGLLGHPELPRAVVYTSDQAHSSVDKAMIALGLGLDQLRRLPTGADCRLRPQDLAAAIDADLAEGRRPLAVLATAGTTSTGAIDPLAEVAAICGRHGLWFHVDAAYGGGAAVVPRLRSQFAGWELADAVVINAHKWLFVPIDCSLLFLRDPELLKQSFSVLPEYLRTPEAGVSHLMDYGIQLGRRFRSLKLWIVLRSFGVEGIRARIEEHLRLARLVASWVEAEPGFELAAPITLAIVAFRALSGRGDEADDRLNEEVLAAVNRDGTAFLSHSKLGGRIVLRVVVGNLRTEERHLRAAWQKIAEAAASLRATLAAEAAR